ncbi:hypothetical protein LLE87_38535, partial [Paenibacillus polymyxa]|nr:hypothetical protein [Paenibacillus polymyxa]
LPTDEAALRRLARGVGLRTGDDVRQAWHSTAQAVLSTHNRVFYSPLVEAVSRIPSEELRMTTDAAKTRLKALGFADESA